MNIREKVIRASLKGKSAKWCAVQFKTSVQYVRSILREQPKKTDVIDDSVRLLSSQELAERELSVEDAKNKALKLVDRANRILKAVAELEEALKD